MKFSKTKIAGVMVIEAEPFIDDRGAFRRHFCETEFAKNNIVTDVSQCNVSENKFAHTLRGFHYQLDPFSEGKTLSCLNGRIFDIVVDLRKESETYMDWVGIELSKENRKSIHIAPGCANAFLTLEDDSLIHYYCSQSYAPESERGIRYNDPSFGFKWPETPKIISEKDLNHPDYKK
jgi:dTDP-4-dehydrorhamnose 3,5-epimerase